MSPRMFTALGGSLVGLAMDHTIVDQHPVLCAVLVVVGLLGLLCGFAWPEGLTRVSNATLIDAHRTALKYRDQQGADAIREELERRQGVRHG